MRRLPGLPGVGVLQLHLERGLSRAVPHKYSTVLQLEGQSESSVRGALWSTRPGTLGVKVPGEVYVDARRERTRCQVLVFDDDLVDEARAALERPPVEPRAGAFDGLSDRRVQPLMALHRAVLDEASGAVLEQALTDALATLVTLATLAGAADTAPERPAFRSAVARARALLDERIAEPVTLDELAAHARLDKFRLCRAFREQVGLPPHAYVTHRRVSLAQELLTRGLSQAEVAVEVGLYDQSQLHRHFKRILGVTPGAWARATR
jgi:AraC-like DNA-binding protein